MNKITTVTIILALSFVVPISTLLAEEGTLVVVPPAEQSTAPPPIPVTFTPSPTPPPPAVGPMLPEALVAAPKSLSKGMDREAILRRITEIGDKMDGLNGERERLIRDANLVFDQMRDLDDEIAMLNERRQEAEERQRGEEDALSRLREKEQELEQARESGNVEDLEEQLERTRQQISDHEEKDLPQIAAEIDKLNRHIEDAQERRDNLDQIWADIRDRYEAVIAELEELEAELEELYAMLEPATEENSGQFMVKEPSPEPADLTRPDPSPQPILEPEPPPNPIPLFIRQMIKNRGPQMDYETRDEFLSYLDSIAADKRVSGGTTEYLDADGNVIATVTNHHSHSSSWDVYSTDISYEGNSYNYADDGVIRSFNGQAPR